MSGGVAKTWTLLLLGFVVFFAIGALREVASPGAIVVMVMTLCLTPFILGPILIHQTYWSALDLGLVPFDPDGPEAPDVLRSHFTATAADLGRFGFTPERYSRTKQATNNADGAVLLFRNPKTWETARILTAVSSDASNAASFTVFSSEFTDGTEVVTSNRTSPMIFPPREPPFHGRAFPQVREVGQLLVVHRARVENLAAGRISVDPIGDDPDGYLRRVDIEVPYAHHVATGYTYVDEMARVQRMTWKGASLSTWKLLPPIKQIRLAWERMMAGRQLSNLESGRPVS